MTACRRDVRFTPESNLDARGIDSAMGQGGARNRPGASRPHLGSAVMSDRSDGTATGRADLQDDTHRSRNAPIGSDPLGWAIERDGRVRRGRELK